MKLLSNLLSNGFGKFASFKFPSPIQNLINTAYVKLLKLDMKEFKSPREYKSLNDLFTRELQTKRVIEDGIISPADSLVTQLGKVEKGKAFQIKGMEYEVEKLLEGAKEVKKILEGEYINLYLSPKDYHRFHMPLKLRVERLIHLPGKLYPVNFFYLKRKKSLFIENERVILECKTPEGKVAYIVLVGALNVGKIKIVFEKRLQTNRSKTPRVFEYKNLWLEKGELLGHFMMGSTILLFFEPNFCNWVVEVGEKVRFGQQIAKRGESSLV